MRWAAHLLGFAVLTLVALGALEASLRLYFLGSLRVFPPAVGDVIPHPTRGWTLAPAMASVEQSLDYTVRTRTNSLGLRDVEHAYAASPGVYRIVVLGDSFMEAFQVAMDEGLPRRLEQRLGERSVEVVNLGVRGYSTTQEYLYLREEGLKYHPNLVLLGFYSNDFRENSRPLLRSLAGGDADLAFARPFASLDSDSDGRVEPSRPDVERFRRWSGRQASAARQRRLVRGLVVTQLTAELRRGIAERFGRCLRQEPNLYYAPFLARYEPSLACRPLSDGEYQALWDGARSLTFRLLEAIRELSAGAGAAFAVFIIPRNFQVEERHRRTLERVVPRLAFDMERTHHELREFCAAHHIPVLDLLPVLRRASERGEGPFYHRIDHHWTAEGHAAAAEAVENFLLASGLVPDHARR